jgi:hypothetical protein
MTFLLTFLFYAISDWLVKIGKLNALTQKRFWNVLLLITFFITALTSIQFGLRGTGFSFIIPFLEKDAHVEYGFTMIAISICHIVWHWSYFKAMISKR